MEKNKPLMNRASTSPILQGAWETMPPEDVARIAKASRLSVWRWVRDPDEEKR